MSAWPDPAGRIRLELGSGYDPQPGFVHLDLNPNAPQVDIVGPAFPVELPDGCCAEIRAVDVLEHISYWETDAALAEWSRLLAPGGRIFIQVPNAEMVMRWFVAATDPTAYLDDERTARTLRCTTMLLHGLPAELSQQTPLTGAMWRLLGGHSDGLYAREGDDWRWNAHYSMWSRDSLGVALGLAGLVVDTCETNPFPNLQCWAVKR